MANLLRNTLSTGMGLALWLAAAGAVAQSTGSQGIRFIDTQREATLAPSSGPELSSNWDATEAWSTPHWGIEQQASPQTDQADSAIRPTSPETAMMYDPMIGEAAWYPGRYLGRGVEYTRELCGYPDLWCPARLDQSPRVGVYLFDAVETFRGIPDNAQVNTGMVKGGNLGVPVPWLERYGVGWQVGGSWGVYNLDGNPNRVVPAGSAEQQFFVTTGFFRRGTSMRPISWGIVYDWMSTNAYGVYSTSPTLGQGRAQMAYAFTARNELGIVGMWSELNDWKTVNGTPTFYRTVGQGNIFWHHKFLRRGSELWLWSGITDGIRANGDDSKGVMTFGGRFLFPLTDRFAFYLHEQSWNTEKTGASRHDTFNVFAGLVFYPGRTARSSTVVGRQWMPYMTVADNGSFLVDTNRVH